MATGKANIYRSEIIFQNGVVEEDVTIIAVKQYHLNHSIDFICSIVIIMLFYFYKMGWAFEIFDKLKGDIYVGTVEHGAMRLKPNHVLIRGLVQLKSLYFDDPSPSSLNLLIRIDDPSFSFYNGGRL